MFGSTVTIGIAEYLRLNRWAWQGKVCAGLLALLLFVNFIQWISGGGCK